MNKLAKRNNKCFKNIWLNLLFLSFVLLINPANAATCNSLFGTGAQMHSSTGYVEMDFHALITGGGTQLATPSIIDNSGWNSCQTSACGASGSFIPPVSVTIPASSGTNGPINLASQGVASFAAGSYTTVGVGQEAHLTFSSSGGTYYANSLTTNYRSQLTLAPGDYYINGNLTIGQETPIAISGTGTARIFVNGTVSFGFKSSTTNVSPARLLIFAKNNISLDNEVNINGFLYSQLGSISMSFRSTVTGGVSARDRIFLDNESQIIYSSSASTADFGNLCNSSAPAINSWTLDVGVGTASTCANRAITITARDSSNNKLTSYTGTVALTTSTSRGTWSKTSTAANANGALAPGAADSGQATYTFTAADAGDIILNLANQHAQSLTITVTDATAGKNSTSASLTFGNNAFVITNTDSLGDDLIAGRSHTLTATMMRRDPTTGDCGAASGYNVAGAKLWLTRVAGDPGGTGPTATNIAGNSSVVLPNTEPGSNNINLNFASGVANFRLLASDVGKYSINIKDASNSFASSAISGNSSNLIARPFGFYIFGTGIPGTSSATGPLFKKAGETFTVSVRAVAWQAADDVNDDGIADGHQDADPSNNAALSNNSALANFGKEVGGAEQVQLGATLFAPSGGANPGLSGTTTLSSFTTGTASSSNIAFNNVGIIELSSAVSDSDYLGAGATRTNKMVNRSGYVGRFYPSAFSLSNIVLAPACNSMVGFSYLGQTFSTQLRLTALTTTGAVASNYRSDFIKLVNLTTAYGAVDLDTPSVLTGRVTLGDQNYTWSPGGLFGVLDADVDLQIARTSSPDGPFSAARIGLGPVDSDGVALLPAQLNLDTDGNGSMDMASLGNTQLRFGRLRLEDSYGPETSSLPVRFLTEYWNGSDWIQNPDDSCTALALTEIIYPQGAINNAANRTVTVGGATTTGEYVSINATQIAFDEGDAGHYFTAPGAGNTGTFDVDVDLTDYPWLRFDWNNDGNYSDAALPSANFTFGNYRGHDRVLYWLEGE
jgi:MSHA biogenesis protein MshQ